MSETSANNRRIAKNMILLYVRTIFVLLISLFTSRVVLQVLGVDNYGIYNVVGGVVGMFSVISGALSNAISRFITFELGKGNKEKLTKIFSTSINIQLVISLLIILLGETLGLWFLNFKMNIPPDRLYAANWVLQCSLLAFVINLISVPYNAMIIAHEKMSAFAYVSILEVSLKLIIVYVLYVSPWDKLVTYSVFLVCVSIIIRFSYSIYCNRHFEETKYKVVHDKTLVKEMANFAGWNFFTNAVYIFNTQGVNILINIFFGVGVNAARGVAIQVEQTVMKFINDFTTAINPQITKCYASGEYNAMNKLICRGAKFSYFLLLLISLPILMETDYILKLWLKTPPDYTSVFLRFTIIATMIDRLGNTGYTACMATGNIKRYVLVITMIGCIAFPITYIVFKFGAPVYSTYIVFICIYSSVDVIRLWIMKRLINFPPMLFVKNVIYKIICVTVLSVISPLIIIHVMEPSFIRFCITTILAIASSGVCAYVIGLDKEEKNSINTMLLKIMRR